jgi:hypothetical protein
LSAAALRALQGSVPPPDWAGLPVSSGFPVSAPLTVYRTPNHVDAWPAFGSATFEVVSTPNVSFGLNLAAQGVAVLLHQQEAAAPVVEPHPCTGTIQQARFDDPATDILAVTSDLDGP